MDWKVLAPLIGAIAPTAGSILGGLIPFPGGSMIGQKFGEIIARQFGATTPEEAAKAITTTAEANRDLALAKINAATAEARAQIDGFVAYEKAVLEAVQVGLKETGQTMRLELAPENRHFFYVGWRPAIGWTFVAFAIAFGSMLTVAASGAAFSDNARPLEILTEAWPIFLAYFGTLALMVGVYIPSRTAEKRVGVDTSAKKEPVPPPVVKPPAKPPLRAPEPRT